MKLLFLCTGNLCRSPFAEYYTRARCRDVSDIEVVSAGTGALPHRPCPPDAVEAARPFGIDLSPHRSRELTHSMAQTADLIVYMSHDHLEALALVAPSAESKAVGLAAYAPGPVRPAEIPDPWGCEPWAYRACYHLMAACLDALLRRNPVLGAALFADEETPVRSSH